jgi:hypothetical protein
MHFPFSSCARSLNRRYLCDALLSSSFYSSPLRVAPYLSHMICSHPMHGRWILPDSKSQFSVHLDGIEHPTRPRMGRQGQLSRLYALRVSTVAREGRTIVCREQGSRGTRTFASPSISLYFSAGSPHYQLRNAGVEDAIEKLAWCITRNVETSQFTLLSVRVHLLHFRRPERCRKLLW